jgi:hypothetical protein
MRALRYDWYRGGNNNGVAGISRSALISSIFSLIRDVAFLDGQFHLVEVHHLQGAQARLNQDVGRLNGQVDARNALLHDVDGTVMTVSMMSGILPESRPSNSLILFLKLFSAVS